VGRLLLLARLVLGDIKRRRLQSPALIAAVLGIPATLLAVAALTAIPARIGAERPVADVLRSE
jgi:hypothetical protein